MKIIELQEKINEDIFKDKLTIIDQKNIVEEIVFHSFFLDEDVKLYKYSLFFKKLYEPVIVFKYFLNEELDDLYIEKIVDGETLSIISEDTLIKLEELFQLIKPKFLNLYEYYNIDLKESIDYEIKYINSIESILSKKLDELSTKIPEFKPDEISKFLTNLEPKNRKLLEKAMVHNESNEMIKKVQKLSKDEKIN